jgi:hypothetical protein
VADFKHHREGNYYTGSNGKRLEYKGTTKYARGREGKVYQASAKGCRECPYRSKGVKSKKEDRGRKLLISASKEAGSLCVKMKEKLNRETYQERYSRGGYK